MKRIFLTIFLIQFLTTGCKADTFHLYKDEINELLRDPKTREIQGDENDVNNLSGCPVLFEMGEWIRFDGRFSGFDRSNVWKFGTLNHHKRFVLHSEEDDLSNNILSNPKHHPIYIGPWHPITLTHTSGSFPFRQTTTTQKQIRFFAYQKKDGSDRINYQYESQTEANKLIPEKKFSLSPTAKYAPDKFSLCVVKWTAKYGYNAVIDLHKNPWYPFFSKNYLVGTGKIIDSETGEIIADEKGNLIKK